MATAHTERGLKTLALMGVAQTGWEIPPITWATVRMHVPTKVTCRTCSGTGQVPDPAADAAPRNRVRCPTCPRRLKWRSHGTGEVVEMVERDVEVGVIQFPEGTRFTSRFSGTQCALCGKRIYSGVSWLPLVNVDGQGRPVGMWVGSDCGRKILDVQRQDQDIHFEIDPANPGMPTSVWREKRRPKPAPKPKPQALEVDHPTLRSALEAIVHEEFGKESTGGAVRFTSYYSTRTSADFHFFLVAPNPSAGYTVKLTAKYGTTIKADYDETAKPLVKDRTQFDAVAALRSALPQIRSHARLQARGPG